MAKAEQVELSIEQEHVLDEVETMVLMAIGEQCAGCSTAKFASHRIGMAVAQEKIPQSAAEEMAERFRVCQGLSGQVGTGQVCHYPDRVK